MRPVSLFVDEETESQRDPAHSQSAAGLGSRTQGRATPATLRLSCPTCSPHRTGLWGPSSPGSEPPHLHTQGSSFSNVQTSIEGARHPRLLAERPKCASTSQARLGSLGWLYLFSFTTDRGESRHGQDSRAVSRILPRPSCSRHGPSSVSEDGDHSTSLGSNLWE